MQKLIVLRFPGKCRKCGKQIAAGERAYWISKGNVQHAVTCTPIEPPKIEIPKVEESTDGVTIFDYSYVVDCFKKWSTGNAASTLSVPSNASPARDLVSNWSPGYGGRVPWAGATVPEMNQWLGEGYRVPGMAEITGLIPVKPRRKLIFGEEGDELLIDLAYAGDDMPFVSWEKRAKKPGLSVEISTTFSANVDASLIRQYQTWIARALQTLDENGVDMEVLVKVTTTGAVAGRYSETTTAKVRVRKAGEASDFSNWSAMFSPAGFRMLGIMSTGLAVDRQGKRFDSGFGCPRPHGKFDVLYDSERNVLCIEQANGGHFPEMEMTEKLVTVLAQIT